MNRSDRPFAIGGAAGTPKPPLSARAVGLISSIDRVGRNTDAEGFYRHRIAGISWSDRRHRFGGSESSWGPRRARQREILRNVPGSVRPPTDRVHRPPGGDGPAATGRGRKGLAGAASTDGSSCQFASTSSRSSGVMNVPIGYTKTDKPRI